MKKFDKLLAEEKYKKLLEKQHERDRIDCLYMWIKQDYITKTEFIYLIEKCFNFKVLER